MTSNTFIKNDISSRWNDDNKDQTLEAIRKIRNYTGLDIYIVGGWVRDAIWGKLAEDVDIVLNTDNIQTVASLLFRVVEGEGGKLIPLDRSRGYWRWIISQKIHLDIVARNGNSIESDLLQRDFTINAIAWNPENGNIIDPCGGIDDCKTRILRSVGEKNLCDDPLRPLRAWRFLSCCEGLAPTEDLKGQISRCSYKVTSAASERILDEVYRCLNGNITYSFPFAWDTGIFTSLWPELRNKRFQVERTLGRWSEWKASGMWGEHSTWKDSEKKYWLEHLRADHSRLDFLGLAILYRLSLDNTDKQLSLTSYDRRWKLSKNELKVLKAIYQTLDCSQKALSDVVDRENLYDLFRIAEKNAPIVLNCAYMASNICENNDNIKPIMKDMLGEFFEKGSTYIPVIPVTVGAILERYPSLRGKAIGETISALNRECARRGSLTAEEVWIWLEQKMTIS